MAHGRVPRYRRAVTGVSDEVRFWADVTSGQNGCLEMLVRRNSGGYATFWLPGIGRRVLAHRWSWENANGEEIPEGLCVLHSCDNPPCVNPAHLRLGTNTDNNADRHERGRDARNGGEACGRSKLTAAAVREIRVTYARSTVSALAAKFGVSVDTVRRAAVGESWRSV